MKTKRLVQIAVVVLIPIGGAVMMIQSSKMR